MPRVQVRPFSPISLALSPSILPSFLRLQRCHKKATQKIAFKEKLPLTLQIWSASVKPSLYYKVSQGNASSIRV